ILFQPFIIIFSFLGNNNSVLLACQQATRTFSHIRNYYKRLFVASSLSTSLLCLFFPPQAKNTSPAQSAYPAINTSTQTSLCTPCLLTNVTAVGHCTRSL
ncbi:hypothetical protein B0T13DRAFT_413763, partial [Neurospora crassa]